MWLESRVDQGQSRQEVGIDREGNGPLVLDKIVRSS